MTRSLVSPLPCGLCSPSCFSLILLPIQTNPPNLFSNHVLPLDCSSCLRPPLFCPSIYLFLCLYCLCMNPYIQMYPALPISHIEESKRPVTIHAWCKKGWGFCQTHPFIVLPYRCLGKNNTPHHREDRRCLWHESAVTLPTSPVIIQSFWFLHSFCLCCRDNTSII